MSRRRYVLYYMQVAGTQIPHWLLEVNQQAEVLGHPHWSLRCHSLCFGTGVLREEAADVGGLGL